MAIHRMDKKVDRQTLQEVGFKIGMAEWVCAKIGNDEEETNRYEATCRDSNGGSLSVVLYFDEDSITLLGVDEVVIDASDRSVKYQIGSTPAWNMLQQAIALYALEQKRIGYTVVPVSESEGLEAFASGRSAI
ncbi:hypothetical protein [Paenibacillus sp. Y412MC10]|uniref:hypothetical protein n=1 Tax=Geobacillus sp. (strain Y412MC10) TaxID=481743 RepID=UPI0011AB4F16|nr:hypothetical protein [Paenibacillus sp. Y412MC10]